MEPCRLSESPSPAVILEKQLDLSPLNVLLNRIDIRQGVSDHCSGSEDFKSRLCERMEVLTRETTITKLDLSNLEPARGELETIQIGPLLHYMGIDPSLITHLSLGNNDLNDFPDWGSWPFLNLRELDVTGNPLKHLPILFLKMPSLRRILTKGTFMKIFEYDKPMVNSKTFLARRKNAWDVRSKARGQNLYTMCVRALENAEADPNSNSDDLLADQIQAWYRCGVCDARCIASRFPGEEGMTRWAPELSMQLHVGTDGVELPPGDFDGAVAINSVALKGKVCRQCWNTVVYHGYNRATPQKEQ